MRLVSGIYEGQPRAGRLISDDEIEILDAPDAVAAWRAGPQIRVLGRCAPQGFTLLAPSPCPSKILGLGLNYQDHIREGGRESPKSQVWFNKQTSALNRPHGDVIKPRNTKALDYEGELVVIIGRRCRHVPASKALSAVAGYAAGCDYSVRDWQKRAPTMHLGKSFDSHAVFGPHMVSAEAVKDPQDLRVRAWVNDELRQDGHTGDMIATVAEQIAYLSQAMTLMPGDVLYTGTPAGVGQWFDPPKYLVVGDRVRVEIDGIGRLENRIVADTSAFVLE